MKFKTSLLSIVFLFFTVVVFADEGMWLLTLLNQLNAKSMHDLGLKMDVSEIYDTGSISMKDAVVIFDGGCTGEIVSDQGLLFTNHHCGFDQIQNHSTLEHNYLKDGFWANSPEEELPNPGCEVLFLERVEDITEKFCSELTDTMSLESRNTKVNELYTRFETEASDSGRYRCEVKSLYEGNKYYIFVYTVYKDVRLVGAPPSSIGKFGFDTDNWVWPRHTGDFSIFRIYTAPDGSPAEYAPENIPLRPKKYFNISVSGINNGDFTFILGYPGVTDRYISSAGVKYEMLVNNDIRIKVRGKRQEILNKAMEADSLVQIQYSSKYYHSSNGWKYSVGQNKELAKIDLVKIKQQEEEKFLQWCSLDSARNQKYGNLFVELNATYEKLEPLGYNFLLLIEAFFRSAEITDLASDFYYLNMLLTKPDSSKDAIAKEIDDLKSEVGKFYKDYNPDVDREILMAMIQLYASYIPEQARPAFYQKLDLHNEKNIRRFLNKAYTKSLFANKEKVLQFLTNPSSVKLSNDPIYKISGDILIKYFEVIGQYRLLDDKINNLNRLYMKAGMEMSPEKYLYPDADFTMRLSYGKVKDYYPREAVHYDYFTTLKGVMEKEDSTNYEFMVPGKLKELYRNKDYGNYGQDSIMPVCFITDNDITGGNSGSPVLNSNGDLIGLAFDGNWESMSSDFTYNSQMQRCICVDIRYVLFIIDRFAGANRIIKELKINTN